MKQKMKQIRGFYVEAHSRRVGDGCDFWSDVPWETDVNRDQSYVSFFHHSNKFTVTIVKLK